LQLFPGHSGIIGAKTEINRSSIKFLPDVLIEGMNSLENPLIMFNGMKSFGKATTRSSETLYYVIGLLDGF